MIRKIITIDEDKCNGCGLCAGACREGAIAMVNGKAKLLRDDYCDGLGNCLPVCPTGAISFEEREAAAYDEEAVKANMEKKKQSACPGAAAKRIVPDMVKPLKGGCPGRMAKKLSHSGESTATPQAEISSRLSQWPCQIKLVAPNASYFDGAKILVAADCTAFAYGNFHEKFIKDHITIIGCPKLDDIDYSEKLTAILKNNNIKSVTVARMEVPCCGGITNAVMTAIKNSGKMIPWKMVVISTDGKIIDET